MRKIWIALLALAVTLSLSGAAFAKGNDKAKGAKGGSATSTEHGRGSHDGDDHGKSKNKSAKHSDHDGDDHDGVGPDKRPKGWDQGKKTGWGDCDLPPGLAKKQGCHSTQVSDSHRHRRHTTTTTRRTTDTTTRRSTTTTKPRTTTTTTTRKVGIAEAAGLRGTGKGGTNRTATTTSTTTTKVAPIKE